MGFRFTETMRGTFRPLAQPDAERTLAFTIEARAPSLRRFAEDRLTEIYGRVVMAGAASDRLLHGTLEIDPVVGRKLVYRFDFAGDDGVAWRFDGRKRVDPRRPLASMTTLHGTIFREGEPWAESVCRFDLRDLPGFLLGWRWA